MTKPELKQQIISMMEKMEKMIGPDIDEIIVTLDKYLDLDNIVGDFANRIGIDLEE